MKKRIKKLGNAFRGIWQVREPTAKAKRGIKFGRPCSEFNIRWYVTFKFNGDFLETEAQSSVEEALDYAIDFLRLNKKCHK